MIINSNYQYTSSYYSWDCLDFYSPDTFSITPNGAWNGSIYYSYDKVNWTLWGRAVQRTSVNNHIYVRGEGNTVITGDSETRWTYTGDQNVYIYGNIETLLDWQTVVQGGHPSMGNYCFYNMFSKWSKLLHAPSLPSLEVSYYGYAQMFSECTFLPTAPALPATSISAYCYYRMFYNCRYLTTAPELPANQTKSYCYAEMFSNCARLTKAPSSLCSRIATHAYEDMFADCAITETPVLDVTYVNERSCAGMFSSCESLTTIHVTLSTTTLKEGCYAGMFSSCTSLTTVNFTLPATTLAIECYWSLFSNCTSLTTAPALPATTLASGCYQFMFRNCTSLTTAPALPATSLVEFCYQYMFRDCTSLNVLPVLPSASVNYCYRGMFENCSLVKVASYSSSTYSNRLVAVPSSASSLIEPVTDMFKGTSGSFTGTPSPGVTYYTSNTVV